MEYSAQIAAQNGANLLDRECPGWAEKIDVNKLDISDAKDCVLGQLYRNFMHGLNILDIHGYSIDYGFCTYIPLEEYEYNLRAEWLKLIEQRVSVPAW